jgi:hypothetical protein
MKALEIYVDSETGEMSKVTETNEFKKRTALFRSDVLQDAIVVLQRMYKKSCEEYAAVLAGYKK